MQTPIHSPLMQKQIGEGATARIIQISAHEVVKVFRPSIEQAWIEREYTIAEFAHCSGIPTPEPLERCTGEGQPAIRFEYADGPNLDHRLVRRFWNYSRHMRQFADAHEEIHARNAEALAPEFGQNDFFRSLIGMSSRVGRLKDKALAALDDLPAGTSLCHGDFSTGNIIVTAKGPVTIDWTAGSAGDPAADVANTWLGMGELIPRSNMHAVIKWGSRKAIQRYREGYSRFRDPRFAERVARWMFPAAAARLGAQELAGVREDFLRVLTDYVHELG